MSIDLGIMINMTKNKINLRQNSRQILLSNNIPITKPRILVLEILLKNEGPLKVEEVIKLSKGKLAISSLYRKQWFPNISKFSRQHQGF